jgi:hypothetical protein
MDIKALVAEEVKAQLATLKAEIREDIRRELATLTSKVNVRIDETCTKIQENNKQIAISGGSTDLAIISDKLAKNMVKLEERILGKVDDKYGVIVQDFIEINAYHHQDTDDLVNRYRTAVLDNDRKSTGMKTLTGRENTKHIISEHVSLAFEYDS